MFFIVVYNRLIYSRLYCKQNSTTGAMWRSRRTRRKDMFMKQEQLCVVFWRRWKERCWTWTFTTLRSILWKGLTWMALLTLTCEAVRLDLAFANFRETLVVLHCWGCGTFNAVSDDGSTKATHSQRPGGGAEVLWSSSKRELHLLFWSVIYLWYMMFESLKELR